jgi:hypothetical protein
VHRLGAPPVHGRRRPWTLHLDDTAAVARRHAQGGTLQQRDDDRPAVVASASRLSRADRAAGPYRAAGLLRGLDASGDPADVGARAIALVSPAQ